ncbi:IS3 family transposase [Bacillus tropicus]
MLQISTKFHSGGTIKFYNNKRFQERLNGLSPLEYSVQAA